MTLPERAKEALENVERIQAGKSAKGSLADRGLARHLGQAEYELERLSKDLARAVVAAEELAKEAGNLEGAEPLGDYEMPMVSLPKSVVDDVLAALSSYRQATGGGS